LLTQINGSTFRNLTIQANAIQTSILLDIAAAARSCISTTVNKHLAVDQEYGIMSEDISKTLTCSERSKDHYGW
jgi:hypothetical protein